MRSAGAPSHPGTCAKENIRMEVYDALYGLKKLAMKDPSVKEALLATRFADNPLKEFCSLSTSYGFPLYEIDLISAGEDAYAAMRRSTNGGGENSPMLRCEDDYYELFLSEISLDAMRQ